MIYIYDLLLNFQDSDRLVEFFEWSNCDGLEHVKKIPLFRIPSVDMNHFCFSNIKVDNGFLEKIKAKTLLYKKRKQIIYASLFCDLNRVVALEFSKDGEILSRSCLLLDEEGEVIDDSKDLDEEVISYKVINNCSCCPFLTREEELEKHYLEKELKLLYEINDVDMLGYLYEEIYGKDNLSFQDRYKRLMDGLVSNFDFGYKKLFDIVRLSYSNK